MGVSSFVALSLGTGIGAAIVLDGRVLRGRHNAAGEIGYLITTPSQLNGGPRAGLEDLISGAALTSRARELAAAAPGRTSMDQSSITPALIFAAAAAGDEVAVGLIGELIDSVAITITAVTTLVDPARVILGGSIGRALAPYLRRIETLVGQVTYSPPELSISSLGPNATVVGAIASALALHRDAHAPTLPDIRTDIRDSTSALTSARDPNRRQLALAGRLRHAPKPSKPRGHRCSCAHCAAVTRNSCAPRWPCMPAAPFRPIATCWTSTP